MIIEEGLWQFILTNEALETAMPTPNPGPALFMDFMPESAPSPSIVFTTITTNSDTTFDGPSGLVTRRFQFNFVASDTPGTPGSGAVAAKNLCDVFRQQCDGLTGTLPNGQQLFNMWLDTEFSDYDSEANKYHMIADYFVQFRRDP